MKNWQCEGFTLAEVAVVVVILGALAAISIPNYINMKEHALEASTKGNAHTVQLAAEVYAIEHFGGYAGDATDLQLLLPRGLALTNPYTGEQVGNTNFTKRGSYKIG